MVFTCFHDALAAFPQLHSVQYSETAMQMIVHYFSLGYKYKEILAALVLCGIRISFRHLKRCIRQLGLRRRTSESDLCNIIRYMLHEMSGSGKCIGYKTMWKRLKLLYGLHVKRSTVLRLMWIIDKDGMERRKKRRLLRRQYSCPGPNFVWHIDGNDKLKPFGFAIHAGIDGYSRKILWLEVERSNNDPKLIARYFLQAVKNNGEIVPTILRSDRGTENTIVGQLQIYFRLRDTDERSAYRSFIMGKSTSNQRVESLWSILRRQCLDFWINLFKDMRDYGLYNDGNMFHSQCLMFCFMPIIGFELRRFATEWNVHNISSGNRKDGPFGKPDVMFHMPEIYDVTSYHHKISSEEIDICMNRYTRQVNESGCFPEFYRLFRIIMPGPDIELETAEDAFDRYIFIISVVEQYI